MHFKPSLFAAILGFTLLPLPAAVLAGDAETVAIETSEVEIAEQSEHRFSVTIDRIPVDTDAVLEFTAWYQAPRIAGYYAGLQLFWNDEELETALDRPAEMPRLHDVKPIPAKRKKWWQVAVLPNPEAANQPDNRYAIDPDVVDVVRFRFPVRVTDTGAYELRIRNVMKEDREGLYTYEVFPTLMLRNVQLHFIPKGN